MLGGQNRFGEKGEGKSQVAVGYRVTVDPKQEFRRGGGDPGRNSGRFELRPHTGNGERILIKGECSL